MYFLLVPAVHNSMVEGNNRLLYSGGKLRVAIGARLESFRILTNIVQYTVILYISSVSSLYRRISVFDMNVQ